MLKENNFTGSLIKITQNDKFVTYGFKLSENGFGYTYTGPNYRNFANWKDYKIGDTVEGLTWLNEDKKLIDADSPAHRVSPLNFNLV
jgi:hypothetical protein